MIKISKIFKPYAVEAHPVEFIKYNERSRILNKIFMLALQDDGIQLIYIKDLDEKVKKCRPVENHTDPTWLFLKDVETDQVVLTVSYKELLKHILSNLQGY